MADICPNCNQATVQHALDSAYCVNCGVKLNYTETGLEADVEVTVASLPSPADTTLATPTATPVYVQDPVGNRVLDTNTEPLPTDVPPGKAPAPVDVPTLEQTESPTAAAIDAGAVDVPQTDDVTPEGATPAAPAADAPAPEMAPAETPSESAPSESLADQPTPAPAEAPPSEGTPE